MWMLPQYANQKSDDDNDDKAWILVHTKPLYSNVKLIAFWRNPCILHDIGLEFCQATISSIKGIVHIYILTGKITQYKPNSQ